MTKVGNRVVAIKSATAEKAIIFGKGVYIGDFIPEEAGGWMAEEMRKLCITNPKIILDNGDVVYGCECWWGPESMLNKYPSFEECSIKEYRKEFETI